MFVNMSFKKVEARARQICDQSSFLSYVAMAIAAFSVAIDSI
jgi:hypothetical protein